MTDDAFIQEFERCTLPFEQWTHRAHVRVAFIYLRRFGLDQALPRLRSGIKAYNKANDVPEGPRTGYNETTTVAFARIVYTVMQAYEGIYPAADSEAFCELHPELMSKHLLRLFYSPERRSHPDAKARFITPDLARLPDLPEERHS